MSTNNLKDKIERSIYFVSRDCENPDLLRSVRLDSHKLGKALPIAKCDPDECFQNRGLCATKGSSAKKYEQGQHSLCQKNRSLGIIWGISQYVHTNLHSGEKGPNTHRCESDLTLIYVHKS